MKKEDEVKRQLKWRLSEKPTVESIEKLVKLDIITREEAKQLLVEESEINPKTVRDLEKEMELLRELVLDIAKREPETIQIIEKHFDHTPYYPWKRPYLEPYWYVDARGTSVVGTASMKATNNALGLNNGQTITMSALSVREVN